MLSTAEPLGSFLLALDAQKLSESVSRFPSKVLQDELSHCCLDAVRELSITQPEEASYRSWISAPDIYEQLKPLKWIIVCIGQTNALREDILQAIAFLKNLGWCHIVVLPTKPILAETCDWVPQLARLGFLTIGMQAELRWTMVFDIAHYKTIPDWLNSRHWANPDLWGKYRW